MKSERRKKRELQIDAAAARAHARRRTKQRFGVKLTRNRKAEILAQLNGGRAKFVRMGNSAFRSVWSADFEGRKVRVVLDTRLNEIVTIYPTSRGVNVEWEGGE